ELLLRLRYCSDVNLPISDGITPSNQFVLKSKYSIFNKLPIVLGIAPPTLLVLKSKWVKFGNEENSKSVNVPDIDASWRLILDTNPPSLHTILVQLQRLRMFLKDHEFIAFDNGGDKEFFHLIKACVCVLEVDMAKDGSNESIDI
ncbi:hypothetical protein Tco_0148021, partial [Tanacetum coccineum]